MSRRTLTHIVTVEQEGRRVRSILQLEMGISQRLITRLKQREGAFRINGRATRTIDFVHAGDVLTAEVGDIRAGGLIEPVAGNITILYEDEDLIILDKPANMATHGRALRGENTVAGAVAAYLGTESPFHAVNRLDRGTTGVMCVAKTGYIHDRLRRELHSDNFRREYLALAVGTVEPPEGMIELPIARVGDKMFGTRADGAPSATRYKTIGKGGGLTLLRVLPETGRTHQIRVHFAAVGCPLLGDRLYGKASEALSRPALHSRSLLLVHPVTGKQIDVSAPLPDDIGKVILRHEIDISRI